MRLVVGGCVRQACEGKWLGLVLGTVMAAHRERGPWLGPGGGWGAPAEFRRRGGAYREVEGGLSCAMEMKGAAVVGRGCSGRGGKHGAEEGKALGCDMMLTADAARARDGEETDDGSGHARGDLGPAGGL